jgi:hypothetical protein
MTAGEEMNKKKNKNKSEVEKNILEIEFFVIIYYYLIIELY